MRRPSQIKEVQMKIDKLRRSADAEDSPIADSEDYIDGPVEKHNNRLVQNRQIHHTYLNRLLFASLETDYSRVCDVFRSPM